MNEIPKPHPDTPARILNTARTVFAAKGYEGASIREITGLAGVNLGAVTYHYRSKQALYEAVLRSFIDPLRKRLDEAVATDGPALDRIERVVRAFIEHFQSQPEQPAVMLHELARQRPLPEPVADWVRTLLQTLGRLIAEGQADGSVIPGPPPLLAVSVVAQPFFLAITRLPMERTPELGAMRPADPQLVTETCVAFVRRSLTAPGRNP